MRATQTQVTVTCDGCGREAADSEAMAWRQLNIAISMAIAGTHMRSTTVDLCDSCLTRVVVPGTDQEDE